jgi:hypothetical protein
MTETHAMTAAFLRLEAFMEGVRLYGHLGTASAIASLSHKRNSRGKRR